MMSNKQNIHVLLELIHDYKEHVFSHLSQETSRYISSLTLKESEKLDSKDMADFLDHIFQLIDHKNKQDSFNDTSLDPIDDSDNTYDDADILIDEDQNNSYPDEYKPLDQIALSLEKQNDQMIAFFLSKVDESFANDIKQHMSDDILERVQSCFVEPIPMAEKIYECLFKSIVIRPDMSYEQSHSPDQESDHLDQSS